MRPELQRASLAAAMPLLILLGVVGLLLPQALLAALRERVLEL